MAHYDSAYRSVTEWPHIYRSVPEWLTMIVPRIVPEWLTIPHIGACQNGSLFHIYIGACQNGSL